ncbi:MAG: biliverdin-producing heme oxygenase [Deltaproteobacteria bacterium]|nr:biliverdin-producing heme oxygenase [Deltaproteobacteria bacterium]
MQQVSGLLTKLNLATRHLHADVDDPWLDLLRPDVNLTDYSTQLIRTYGLIAPFESACKYTPGVARMLDYRQLLRAGLIARDLLALGMTPGELSRVPTCPAITMFRDASEAFGWLYVVERSTLLQEGVRRHLIQRLPSVMQACHYLGAYEGHINDHWLAFGRQLDRIAADQHNEHDIISSAEAAFRHTREWLAVGRANSRWVV